MRKALFVSFLAVSAVAFAGSGTLTRFSTTWNGIPRTYSVYVPQKLSDPPALLVVLHPTSTVQPPLFRAFDWEKLADQYGFVIAWPIAKYNPWVKTWHWECDGCESGFRPLPDDSGFVRSVIVSLQSQYHVPRRRTFVVGMSSGGFMAERVGMESSDLVAAIAPVSAAQYIQPVSGRTFSPPILPNPISVYELHGDVDAAVPYCGGTRDYWGVSSTSPSMDSDVAYWSGPSGNNCGIFSVSAPLCTNGQPTTGVNGQDATGCSSSTEVIFKREVGVAHTWPAGTEAKVWAFFLSHQGTF